jgi:hypothetical protein
MSFVRRAKTSGDKMYRSTGFMKPLDQFVMSGLKFNPCLSKEAKSLTLDPTDAEAVYFVAERSNCSAEEQDPSVLLIPKGIFMAAAIYHGAIAACDLDTSDGPDLPIWLAAPGNSYNFDEDYRIKERQQQQEEEALPPPTITTVAAALLPPPPTTVPRKLSKLVPVTESRSLTDSNKKNKEPAVPPPMQISEPKFVSRRGTTSGIRSSTSGSV